MNHHHQHTTARGRADRGRACGRTGHGRRALAKAPLLVILVLLLLVALAPAAQAASPYSRTIRDGRAAARALLAETGAPSLSLALVSNGRIVWRQSFGYADVEKQARPTAATRYGIGSVSKTVATVALMQLVDDGLVALDEPVTTYIPTFSMASPGYRNVTVRMLLDHSSGLPGSAYGSGFGTEYWPGYLDQLLRTLQDNRLKHTPGALSVYCNDGFTLLEAIVAEVTGTSYAQYVQEEIFDPLGMTHSAYPLQAFADGSYAKAYGPDGAVHQQEVVNLLASGAVYSTPTDMARFATMLMNRGKYGGRRILSAAAVAEMGTDQTVGQMRAAPCKAARYGLGWDSVTQPGLLKAGFTAWMKGGDTSDYHTGLVVVPGEKLAAVVTGVAPITSTTAETLCERLLLHALMDRGKLRRLPRTVPAVAPPVKKATAAQLRAIKGYWAGSGMVVRVDGAAVSQALTASTLGQDGTWYETASDVRLRKDGRFHRDGSPRSLRVTSAAGRRYLISRAPSGNGYCYDDMPVAQKLTAGEPLSKAWASRVGDWWVGVNEHPESAFWGDGEPLLRVAEVPGLQGYVLAITSQYGIQVVDPGELDAAALMFLQIPGFGSRDLNDLVVEERGGEEWMWYGTTLHRPLDGVPALGPGANVVETGAEGYAEWRMLSSAAQVTIANGTRWRAYDSAMTVIGGGTDYPAEVEVPEGGYLCLFAPGGTEIGVAVMPTAKAGSGPAPRQPAIPSPVPALDDPALTSSLR